MSLPFISICKIVKQKGFSFDEIVQSWTKEIASVLFYLFYITLGLFNSLQKCIFSKHLLHICYLLTPMSKHREYKNE